MNGVLVVDKPQGVTSFDVVRDVRKALGVRKAGHTGTLDPMATGVLAVCLGDATRIAQYLTDGDKAYEAVLRLGAETDT
ncbi:MAG: tRNA pseudouridine(55) synthase TruB, partial [Archangium sp.]|nr:tRNA pseudouridine(55) synthase TruB [Archangium sp.]